MPTRTAERTADALAKVLDGLDRDRAVHAAQQARRAPRVLRASGVKIENMTAERLRAVAGQRQAWQATAWGYRDMITELRFALQFRARTTGRIRLYVAQVNPEPDDEPLPLALRHDTDKDGTPTEKSKSITLRRDLCQAAEDELDRLPLDDAFGFIGTLTENFDVAGEAWLHGFPHQDTGEETWQIRSVLDVDTQGSTLTVKDELGQPRPLNLGRTDEQGNPVPGTEEIYRLWVPHPAHPHLADSALQAMLDVLEDICLCGRELRAVARSRIASNGVWLVTESAAALNATLDDDDTIEKLASRFMADLTASLLAPIMNEGDPGAVAPIIITASREDIEVMKDSFIRFAREDSPTLLDKLAKSLSRMATGLDIPPEILTGMGEVNHWTAWQIDNATFRHYLEPSIRLMADALTAGFLRKALTARGFPAEEVAKIRIWYDAGQITENPNRRQDAIDARDRAAISDDAFRKALGFNEGDAPTAAEQILMIAAKQGMDTSAATALLRWFAEEAGAQLPPEIAPAPQPKQLQPAEPAAEPDDAAPGGAGTPDTAPPAVAASARPGDEYALDVATGRMLMELERGLRDWLLAQADAATTRALERAGSRLRSKATRDPALTAALRGHPIERWPMVAGRQQALGVGADLAFLLAEAWRSLKDAFTSQVRDTIGQIADRAASRLLPNLSASNVRNASIRIRTDMESRLDAAWNTLQAGLDANAERLMFDAEQDDQAGEMPALSVPPALVRQALAEIGGLPEGSGGLQDGSPVTGEPLTGLATGAAVTRELEAAGTLTVGYVWVYGVTPMRRQFEPHRELEGEKFTSWADPKLHPEPQHAWVGPFYRPGDHRGCMCDYVPAYALPDYAAQVRDRIRITEQPTKDLLALAAEDDRAGRTGTTAQATRDQYRAIAALQSRFLEAS